MRCSCIPAAECSEGEWHRKVVASMRLAGTFCMPIRQVSSLNELVLVLSMLVPVMSMVVDPEIGPTLGDDESAI